MLRKTRTPSGKTTRVTFEVPVGVRAERVHLCGEFNEWSQEATPLARRQNGRFSTTVSLPAGRRYRFRYLLDGERWENDSRPDAFVKNEFGEEDSVVET